MSCQTKLDKYIFKTPKFEIAPLIGCTESFSQPLCPHRGGYPLYKTIGFLEPNDPDFIQLIPRGMYLPYTETKTNTENLRQISEFQQIVYSTQVGSDRPSTGAVSAVSFDKPNR